MRCRLALASAVVPLVVAACGGGSSPARQLLVYEKPAGTFGEWGWIWRAAPDGSNPHKVVLGYGPQVSPDGRWIAYVHNGQRRIGNTTTGYSTLWIVSTQGTGRRQLPTQGRWFSVLGWAPDSRHLLMTDEAGLELLDRSGQARLLARTKPRKTAIEAASFSPDGRQVVYERDDQQGSDLYVVAADGGPSRRLTHDRMGMAPVWGPTAIAYCRCDGNVSGDIWLVSANGSHSRRLTHTNGALNPAAWSSDGRRLLADYPPTHNGRLWAVEVPSGRARPLTPWQGDLYPQGLSGDGRTVYAALGCGGTTSPYGYLETIPFAGGPPKVIVRGPCRGSWSN